MSAQCTKTAWLSSKLKQFALDEEIYLNYIESVLDGEEDRCEKISALEAILGEVLVSFMPYGMRGYRQICDLSSFCHQTIKYNNTPYGLDICLCYTIAGMSTLL